MEALHLSPGTTASLVVAISFAAGLNVYATVLTLGVLARLHWVELPSGLAALSNPWILGACAALFTVEFFADKIPAFDLVWNALHTFVRIPVAALLAYGAASHLSPGLQLLATVAGGLIAGVAHSSKTAVRMAVTPSPEPVSNVALSTVEDGVAVSLTWFATHHPYAAGGIGLSLTVAGIAALWWSFRQLRKGWGRLRETFSGSGRNRPTPVSATATLPAGGDTL